MKEINYSPEAQQDLMQLKNGMTFEHGEVVAKKVIAKITKSIRMLGVREDAGKELSKTWGIACDYKYFFTAKNYVFYRVEGETVKIIRVLNEKQDFMNILLGIETITEESEEYWNE